MLIMILKMTAITALYVILSVLVFIRTRNKKLTIGNKMAIGLVFGLSSVLSTHFGVSYENMIINVRDIGPLAAGLFFSPLSGVIAGLIGGIERYIAGTYFGVGPYTRIACSISTCLAGFVAMGMNIKMFRGKKPSFPYAFFMGAVMEVFHMYVVFITHRNDMRMAFTVVSTCAVPMIIFTGLGMAISSAVLQMITGEWKNPFIKTTDEETSLSQTFQKWLFIITSIVILGNFVFSYALQTQSALQDSKNYLEDKALNISKNYQLNRFFIETGNDIVFSIISPERIILKGKNTGMEMPENEYDYLKNKPGFTENLEFWGTKSLVYTETLWDGSLLAVSKPNSEIYWNRDAQAYEIALSDILLFAVIYILIAFLANQIVVNNIHLINNSLAKITHGNLNEIVTVRSSSEFASLSDDINQTVDTLKNYIDAAEKRIEQELVLARTIQLSSLPNSFSFPDRDEFEIFAMTDPAKEVGGDFYDFFFISRNQIALVVSDVSGKGIPASLFMMRSKTAIRSFAESGGTPAEIFMKANETLYEGNDAEMFVTSWIGLLDLTTGLMRCANAGHEYPVIRHRGGEYELIKDKHTLAIGAYPSTKAKEYELQLIEGDRLFLYSDGIPEAIDENVKQFGTDGMLKALNDSGDMSLNDLLPYMRAKVDEFKGAAEQFDDITMLGFDFIKKDSIS